MDAGYQILIKYLVNSLGYDMLVDNIEKYVLSDREVQ